MRGSAVAKFLRKLADAVEKLDEVELDRFLSNSASSDILSNDRADKKHVAKKNTHAKVDPVALTAVFEELSALSTREAGAELLNRMDFGRKHLEALARMRNIHITKDDNIAKIKEKLIEGAIGARLSSRAIRGMEEGT